MPQKRDIDTISDVAAERALLSLMLNNNKCIYDILNEISPDDFVNLGNKFIIRTIKKYFEAGGLSSLDVFTLASLLDNEGLLDKVGGLPYLETLAQLNISRDTLEHYVNRIKFCSLRREIFQAAEEIKQNALDPGKEQDPLRFLSIQEKILSRISLDGSLDKTENLVNNIEEVPFGENYQQDTFYLKTLFPEFDKEVGGLESGKLYIIAARSKTYKSTTLLNMAYNVIMQDYPVLYLDTEMDRRSQQIRLLSIASNVDEKKIRRNMYINSTERKAILKAQQKLKMKKLFHRLMPGFIIEEIIHLARHYKAKEDIKLLIFDYIKSPNDVSLTLQERQLLGVLTSTLKDLASELKIPVLSACQLNRQAVDKSSYRETYIAESDRILWFTDYLFYQRLRTEEDMAKGVEGKLILEAGPCRYGCSYEGWFDIFPSLRMKELRNAATKELEQYLEG